MSIVEEISSSVKSTSIVFSFDTTGSMSPCIAQVRQHLRSVVEKMTADIPGVKIGLIAHGDYCDEQNAIQSLDLTSDIEAIMKFISDAPNTSGGDAPECYELALNRARTFSWPKEGGSLVLIGDDVPHEPSYYANTNCLDWRQEVRALKEMNVKVFPMQCLKLDYRKDHNKFWEDVSGESGAPLLVLDSFDDSTETLTSVAYASAGEEAYTGYLRKCAMTGSGEETVGRSMNLAQNREKLKDFTTENKPK